MTSINSLIVTAEGYGRDLAYEAHNLRMGVTVVPGVNEHNPGDDIGRLVLDAFRNYGVEEMKSVVKGYQVGYNTRAQELGDDQVRWVQIKNGIKGALAGATHEEGAAITAAL